MSLKSKNYYIKPFKVTSSLLNNKKGIETNLKGLKKYICRENEEALVRNHTNSTNTIKQLQ